MVITSKKYNEMDINKWNNKVDEWRKSNSSYYMPQLAFYGFRNKNGSLKNYGYVAYKDNHSHWFRTKKEALKYNF